MVAKTIDLSQGDGHVWKLTLDTTISTDPRELSFTNYPTSGKQREWELEFIQDGTGGIKVTQPAEVVDNVSIDLAANATTIITYRTNDGGATVFALAVRHGGTSGSPFLPLSGGTMTGTLTSPAITMTGILNMDNNKVDLDADQDTSISSPSDDAMTFEVGNNTRLLITNTTFDLTLPIDMNDLDITSVKEIIIGNQGAGVDPSMFANNASGKEITFDADTLILSRQDIVQDLDVLE